MRVFYIFNIREEFKYLYQDSPSMLYNILKQIYYLGHDDILYGQNLFRQLTKSLPKDAIDRALFIKLHQEFPYSKRGDNHIMKKIHHHFFLIFLNLVIHYLFVILNIVIFSF